MLDEWKDAMSTALAKGDPNHDQYWLNGGLRPRDFTNLKLDRAARAAWLPAAAANILATSTAKGGAAPVRLPQSADDFDGEDASLRALFLFKRKFGAKGAASASVVAPARAREPRSQPRHAALDSAEEDGPQPHAQIPPCQTVGTFPIAEVSNGHTFFVQKLHDIVGVPPVCVHTTYQYGDADYPYGKRERLRDAHLWLLDTPDNHWSGRFLR